MGASNSKIKEDKALQLCRERKRYVRQALDGRCSLAAAHHSYIQSLRSTGTALKKFVQPEAPVESSLCTPMSAAPEPHALTNKPLSHFSYSSPTLSQHADATEHFSSTTPPASTCYHAHPMKFRSSFTEKVDKIPLPAIIGTLTSSSTPQSTTPLSLGRAEASPFEAPSDPAKDSPWDFFGISHPMDNHISSGEQGQVGNGLEHDDSLKQIREKEGIPDMDDEDEKISSHGHDTSDESDDEFDDPSSNTLVRSFENLNIGSSSASPFMPTAGSVASENEVLNGENVHSPKLSSFRTKSPEVSVHTEAKTTPVKDEGIEHKVAPKDFFSSMRDVEYYFLKASDSGREVPRMLEANKLHFRPILPGQESGVSTSSLLKACFSCGDDPSQVQEEEPAQASVMYLTWHRTASSRSSSSQNPIASNSREDIEDMTSNLFDSFSMISRSHASTLDRLYAWERKLYDEVKASQIVRRDYDMKCALLRQQESRDESKNRIGKTHAIVKDLHSRIGVAIQRIDSVSKRIEDLREKELQPQLEELIEGLRRMWEVMSECHRLQVHTVTISCHNGNLKIVVQSESQRHFTLQLQGELNSLASSFTKWIGAHKVYLQSINNWLLKCAPVTQPVKRKRRQPPPPLSDYGPPIYTTCKVWLELLEKLPTKKVSDAIKGLAAEISGLLTSHQDRNHGKNNTALEGGSGEIAVELLNDSDLADVDSAGYDQLKPSLVIFLSTLSNFAGSSVRMYGDLQKIIQDAKRKYEHLMSQPS